MQIVFSYISAHISSIVIEHISACSYTLSLSFLSLSFPRTAGSLPLGRSQVRHNILLLIHSHCSQHAKRTFTLPPLIPLSFRNTAHSRSEQCSAKAHVSIYSKKTHSYRLSRLLMLSKSPGGTSVRSLPPMSLQTGGGEKKDKMLLVTKQYQLITREKTSRGRKETRSAAPDLRLR